MNKGKYPQYYLIDKNMKGNKQGRRYLKRDEIDIARQIAQKEYDTKCYKALCKYEQKLKKIADSVVDISDILDSVFNKMHPAKQVLITKCILSDEEYIEKWYEKHPGNTNSFQSYEYFTTERGEKVRSKTEKMIADKLYFYDIPYQYEPSLTLLNQKICPDFIVLNKFTRKTFIFEHFGKMDDPTYCKKTIERLELYKACNYWPGDNLVYTMECSIKSINMDEVTWIIEKHFM